LNQCKPIFVLHNKKKILSIRLFVGSAWSWHPTSKDFYTRS